MSTTPERPEPIQSLVRGLSVITAFGEGRARLTLSEVARQVGLSRATARRVLHTLVDLGYAATDGQDFWLTPRILSLGYSYLSSQGLPQLANPHLKALSDEVRESTSLTVLDQDEVVYVTRMAVRRIMRSTISVGTRFPAHATSMGRVLLAGLPEAELDAYFARSERRALTPATVTDEAALRRILQDAREEGWTMVIDELEPGVCSVAAPLLDRSGKAVAAINASMASGAGARERLEQAAPAVIAAAHAISVEIQARESLSV